MPSAHAKLSPSSSAMWISCPASIGMKERHATELDDKDSVYAREGTLCHALAELEASLYFGLTGKREYNRGMKAFLAEFNAEGYPDGTLEEMQGHVRAFIEYIKERKKRRPRSRIMLEQRMDSGIPTCWGTSDVVIVSPTHVEIIDLKYGQGYRVDAQGNSQLRIYALGALDTFSDLLGEPDMVYASVFQPRLDHYDTEEITPDELRRWREEDVMPRAELALGDNAPFGPSEAACRWCPVAAICRVRVEAAVAEDFGDDFLDEPIPEEVPKPEVLTPEELSAALARAPFISAWLAALEKYALDYAYAQGQTIPGYKVVRSGGIRFIKDHAAAIQTLIDQGYKATDVSNIKAKGIGDLEKLVGKKDLPVVLAGLIGKTTGKESLVPESDKRDPISPASEAGKDFALEDMI